MRTRLPLLTLAIALMTTAAGTSQAQAYWSTPASGCVIQTAGHNSAYFSAVYGTVSFAPGNFGDIKLTCPIPFLFASPYGPQPSALYITYYNDNGTTAGVNHCYISADLLRSNLNDQERGGDLASLNTAADPSDSTAGSVLSVPL